ncbi:hypothetical protein HPB49_025412 [Dermacentor silvarum]|uniref:Uncharacterized protein n=1 Tax=Dermacentor silvarum TaxID=543639 RepID=A0ACB8D9C4_DERSI|nr:hypothetical protein HPB49_025412 [Dermacentor silvarum]
MVSCSRMCLFIWRRLLLQTLWRHYVSLAIELVFVVGTLMYMLYNDRVDQAQPREPGSIHVASPSFRISSFSLFPYPYCEVSLISRSHLPTGRVPTKVELTPPESKAEDDEEVTPMDYVQRHDSLTSVPGSCRDASSKLLRRSTFVHTVGRTMCIQFETATTPKGLRYSLVMLVPPEIVIPEGILYSAHDLFADPSITAGSDVVAMISVNPFPNADDPSPTSNVSVPPSPKFVRVYPNSPRTTRYLEKADASLVAACFFFFAGCHTLLALLVACVFPHEAAHWKIVKRPALNLDNVTIRDMLAVMLATTITFILMITYLSQVLPWTTLRPQQLLFPILPSYWNPPKAAGDTDEEEGSPTDENRFEQAPNLKPAIECKNLSKAFDNIIALNKVDLVIYGNQVTVLLGHNGAGKTTLMSILTGLLEADSGAILLRGREVNSYTVRGVLGFCPQTDVFFPDLTVLDHLQYFGIVLILDEPTVGMDPETRRVVWTLVQGLRGRTTLLLSTHDMEEAERLGDRIIVMYKGHVICSGSTSFLKNACGVGYKLRISKKPNAFKTKEVLALARKACPQAIMEEEKDNEAVIAMNTLKRDGFQAMFLEFERKGAALGILSLGVSVATMKDAYLK